MNKPAFVVVGAVLVLAGAVFFLQGIDVLHGSTMSGSAFWAVAGPVLVLVGLALVRTGARSRPR